MDIRLTLVFTRAPLERVGDVSLLCAGQDCAKREHCLRYKIRRNDCAWASFDRERGGKECPGYVDNWMRRKAMDRR